MTNILVIGSNGMVGQDLMRLLEDDSELYNIVCCNSCDFVEKTLKLDKYNVIFNCSNEIVSREIVNKLSDNIIYIDNSSYLRMRDDVPLVVPEINMIKSKMYANPNCVSIILCLFLNGIKNLKPYNIEVSTYQSLSGAGKERFNNFINDTKRILDKLDVCRPLTNIMENSLGFNFYPHESKRLEDGFSGEENKVIKETKKIIGLDVFPTCIRIPSVRCHGENITCEFGVDVNLNLIKSELIKYGIEYSDNINCVDCELNESIKVGHIRKSRFGNRWSFFVVGDQLTRGASYNAYKIFKSI